MVAVSYGCGSDWTPVLDYDEVAVLVGRLPDGVLAELRVGPVGDRDFRGCRVCRALNQILPQSANQMVEAEEEPDGPVWAAHTLQEWHDNLQVPAILKGVIGRWVTADREYERAANALRGDESEEEGGFSMLGHLAYARCCTIYALAELEFTRRPRS